MGNHVRNTLFLLLVVIIATLVMFDGDKPKAGERELILFCDSTHCTTAAGAFWALQDSLDAADFFYNPDTDTTYRDEALPGEG